MIIHISLFISICVACYICDRAWENRYYLAKQNTVVHIMVPISCSVCGIEFLMEFCIYDDILDTILITDKSYYILNSQNQVKSYV